MTALEDLFLQHTKICANSVSLENLTARLTLLENKVAMVTEQVSFAFLYQYTHSQICSAKSWFPLSELIPLLAFHLQNRLQIKDSQVMN